MGETRVVMRGVVVAVVLSGAAVTVDRWADAGTYLAPLLLVAILGGPIVAVDLAEHRIPTRLVFTLAAMLGLWGLWQAVAGGAWWALGRGLVSGLLVAGVFWLKWFLGGTGRGDLRLAGVLAAAAGWLGWGPVAAALVVPYLLVFPLAVLRMARGRRDERIPFAPALVAGWFAAVALHLLR